MFRNKVFYRKVVKVLRVFYLVSLCILEFRKFWSFLSNSYDCCILVGNLLTYRYGEGWDFGEVAKNGRGINASQFNICGTGIGRYF